MGEQQVKEGGQRGLGFLTSPPTPPGPPPLEGTCSTKGAPGTRCRLVWLRSKEKGDDTKRQDVSSASSISPPARHRVQRGGGERPRKSSRRAQGAAPVLPAQQHTESSPGCRPSPIYCLFAEASTGPSTQMAHNVCAGQMDDGQVGGWKDGWADDKNELRLGKVPLPQKPPRSTDGDRQSSGSFLALGPR